jgi:hypothetical protein
MDRAMLIRHLDQAERHLAKSEDHVRIKKRLLDQASPLDEVRLRRAFDLSMSLRLKHAAHLELIRKELGFVPVVVERLADGKNEEGPTNVLRALWSKASRSEECRDPAA